MRKLILFFVALIISSAAMAQQKNCYIYSQKIFKSMPEYNEAVKSLDAMTQTARTKADALLAEAKQMFDEFKQYQNDMSNVQRERYKKMIIDKEKEANDYEKRMFGEEGEVAKRQKELMDPIERKVLAVVESFAKRGGYDMIFDLSLVKVTIYQSDKLDVTDKIIEEVKNYNYK